MFKLAITPSYTANVKGTLPGMSDPFTFDVEFKRITQSEIAEIGKGDANGNIIYADVCRNIVIGWQGVTDENGDVSFSLAQLDKLLGIFPMGKIIYEAWQNSLQDARLKN
jgi:hypothetical protein